MVDTVEQVREFVRETLIENGYNGDANMDIADDIVEAIVVYLFEHEVLNQFEVDEYSKRFMVLHLYEFASSPDHIVFEW